MPAQLKSVESTREILSACEELLDSNSGGGFGVRAIPERLDPGQAKGIAAALRADHELARRYDLVRDELAETIDLNETLGAPSVQAMQKLFAAIDAERDAPPRPPRRHALVSVIFRMARYVASGSAPSFAATPRPLQYPFKSDREAMAYDGDRVGKDFREAMLSADLR